MGGHREADDIDVVSVVMANHLHREIVERARRGRQTRAVREAVRPDLGRCPAMADAREASTSIARIGFTFRRTPGIAYIRDLIQNGDLGECPALSQRPVLDRTTVSAPKRQ